jgi:hypothetical protein
LSLNIVCFRVLGSARLFLHNQPHGPAGEYNTNPVLF